MGRVINIANKLDREPRFLVIDEKHRYKVNCSKNAVSKVMDLDSGEKDLKYIDQALKILLGNEAVKEIDSMDLPFDAWTLIVKGALAVAMNKDLEDVESDFRTEKESD